MKLQARNLTAGYRGRPVLENITLGTDPGQMTVLIGANGSGKSTLLRTLTGAQAPLGGQALIDGRAVDGYTARELARRLSVVLTDRAGGGGLTVAELVAIGRHPYSGFTGRLGSDDRRAVADAIAAVGLEAKTDDFVASLSDGERQKAMIARAIAQDTSLMVLDEPTSFLDVAARFEIMSLLHDVARRGTTVLLSTHDIAPALALCDNLWAVTADRRVTAGGRDEMIASGVLDGVYPGAVFDPSILDFRPTRQ